MARKPDPNSKAGFVRSLPATLSAAEVVAKAKEAGVKLDASYVYNVRRAKKAKRGRSSSKAATSARDARSSPVATGLVAEIEQIVERKVAEILRGELGVMFGSGGFSV